VTAGGDFDYPVNQENGIALTFRPTEITIGSFRHISVGRAV